MKREVVKSLAQLDNLLKAGHHEYYISFGALRSSKWIDPCVTIKGSYWVMHYSDGSDEIYSPTELMASNIGTAMKNGCFICEHS